MSIKEIIDAERWEPGDHGLAPMPSVEHNASLERIEAGVSCVSEYVAELEAELEEYKGHFVDGLKECWYRGESIKALQENLDNANKRIAELEAQRPARVMKRWGLDGFPKKHGYYWIATSSRYEGIVLYDRPAWFTPDDIARGKEKCHGRKITHWLELEPTLIIPKDGDA